MMPELPNKSTHALTNQSDFHLVFMHRTLDRSPHTELERVNVWLKIDDKADSELVEGENETITVAAHDPEQTVEHLKFP